MRNFVDSPPSSSVLPRNWNADKLLVRCGKFISLPTILLLLQMLLGEPLNRSAFCKECNLALSISCFQVLDPASVPDALRFDLLCCLASLRCRMYGIVAPAAGVDRRDVRLFDNHRQQQGAAGCPCPAPVADVLAGLVSTDQSPTHFILGRLWNDLAKT